LARSLGQRLQRFGGAGVGPAHGELAILTPERLPAHAAACLLEIDDLSSREGERRLRDPRALDELARAIVHGVDDYLGLPRYGHPGDGGEPEQTRPANPAEVAEQLLAQYLRPYLDRLSGEAKRRLIEGWRESPGGVIAAGSILGAAGVAFLVGTNSALPTLPAIPLDTLGGPFQGAELQLRLNGPITSPESFQFVLTFREPPAARPARERPRDSATIDELLPPGHGPEQIATQIDGPEFETEVPDQGPSSDIALYLAEFVRGIGNQLLREVEREPARPWLDLGQLPPLPGNFGVGLTRLIDALIEALPERFGSIEQVSFITHAGSDVRWIPVIPTARRSADQPAEAQAFVRRRSVQPAAAFAGKARFGDAQPNCALRVEFPTTTPNYRRAEDPFRISNNHTTTSRILFDGDVIVFEFDQSAAHNVNCQITLSDDAGNGLLCQTDIDLHDAGKAYVQFSRFPLQADQSTRMTSCSYEVAITNLDRHEEGVELWMRIYV